MNMVRYSQQQIIKIEGQNDKMYNKITLILT